MFEHHDWKYDAMGYSRYHVVVISCDLESFDVGISSSYVNINAMENISYTSDLISVHRFDIYHLIYMLCIFAVYFYLLRAHWEHFARDSYTSCTLGTLIHSITSCALGTLRVCWVHFMYIDIWQYFVRAGFIDTWHRWFVVFELYILSVLLIHLLWLWHSVDSRDIYFMCLNFYLCFCVYDFCRNLRTL